MSHHSVFSTTFHVTCRPHYLPKAWIQLYCMELNNCTTEIIWKVYLKFNLELNCKFLFWNNCRDKFPSSPPSGFLKIYWHRLLFSKMIFRFQAPFWFPLPWGIFPSLNNKCRTWGITNMPVKYRQLRTPSVFVLTSPHRLGFHEAVREVKTG